MTEENGQIQSGDAMADLRDQIAALLTETKEAREETMRRLDSVEERAQAATAYDERLDKIEARFKEVDDEIQRRPGTMGAEQKDFGPEGFMITRMLFNEESAERKWSEEYSRKRVDPFAGVTRAQDTSTNAKGSFAVSQEMLPGFIESARSRVVVWDPALITVHEGITGGPVTLTTEVGNTTVAWGTENHTAADTEIALGQVSASPNRLSAKTEVSRRLGYHGVPMENWVRRNLSRSIGLEVDRVLVDGEGTGDIPEGVMQTGSVLTHEIDTNGGRFTLDDAAAMQGQLEDNDTDEGDRVAFIGRKICFNLMMRERILQFSGDTAGAYVHTMDMRALEGAVGVPIRKTNVFPNDLTKGSSTALSAVILGNWEDLHLFLWQDLEFRLLDQLKGLEDQNVILVNLTADVDIARASSFVVCNDAATTDPVS